MEVVIFTTSVQNNPTSIKAEEDFELYLEPEYFYKKKEETIFMPFENSTAVKHKTLRKYKKLDTLLKDQKYDNSLMENLKLIEDKEKEIKISLSDSIKDTLTDDTGILSSEFASHSNFEDAKFNSILSKRSMNSYSNNELSTELLYLVPLLSLNINSEWTSVKTRLLLNACSQAIPKHICSSLHFFNWIKESVCKYFQPSLFITQLAISGALLRLPSLDKTMLLNLQQLCIQFSLLSYLNMEIYVSSLTFDSDSIAREFTYPIIVFHENSSSRNDILSKTNNSEFLAMYTLFLQSHIHIIQYILEYKENSKKINSKFSNYILETQPSQLENAKSELCSFLKSLASRLMPGLYILLQEIILSYQTLLLK